MPDLDHKQTDPARNLVRVLAEVEAARKEANREEGSVTLVAVSKTKPVEDIRTVLEAGQRVFGENRVQEAENKWPALKEAYPDVRLHLIGPLQTNKARPALELFDMIETVDRPKLARTLARLMDETGHRPGCFIQINTGEEEQKAGIIPREADAFIAFCRDELKLPVRGLMCIPPVDEEPALHFALLSEMAKRNGLNELSMGMSADYPVAVRFGATHVRVGTAIFGARARPE